MGSLPTRTKSRTDEERLVAAFKRRFRAVEVDPWTDDTPPPPPATSSSSSSGSAEPDRCHLCHRSGRRLVTSANGMKWCPDSDWDVCNRIAQGRLGASGSTGSSAALKGILDTDGKCRDCHEPIKWVKTQRGKKMPVDVSPAPADLDAFELIGRVDTLAFFISSRRRATHSGDVYACHFNTCSANSI